VTFMSNNENEYEQGSEFVIGPQQGWGGKLKNWLKNNSSIILAIAVIIVLGGSIYAYTKTAPAPLQNNTNEKISLEDLNIEQEQEQEQTQKQEQNQEQKAQIQEKNQQTTVQEQGQEKLNVKETPDSQIISANNEKTYNIKATSGDGITHLARRALKIYLEKTGGDNSLTKEHKIYIEDYLQNRIGEEFLNIGETRQFTEKLIKQAIDSSKKLTQEQLDKITPYANLVPNL